MSGKRRVGPRAALIPHYSLSSLLKIALAYRARLSLLSSLLKIALAYRARFSFLTTLSSLLKIAIFLICPLF